MTAVLTSVTESTITTLPDTSTAVVGGRAIAWGRLGMDTVIGPREVLDSVLDPVDTEGRAIAPRHRHVPCHRFLPGPAAGVVQAAVATGPDIRSKGG